MVAELLAYAERHRLRAYWFTFTSHAEGSREVVRQYLKRCWARFRHCASWRRVPGALVIFATHGRPHVHVLAVIEDVEALARYCSAQRDRSWQAMPTSR